MKVSSVNHPLPPSVTEDKANGTSAKRSDSRHPPHPALPASQKQGASEQPNQKAARANLLAKTSGTPTSGTRRKESVEKPWQTGLAIGSELVLRLLMHR